MANPIARWAFVCASASAVSAGSAAFAQGADEGARERGDLKLDSIVVTAQRKEQTLQDVPISVAVRDAAMLDALQVDGVSDLQLTMPNVYFTKGNFSGSNLQIRGVGSLIGSTSADSGIGAHVNDVYINSPRLFEAEYYDVDRVEVLRGPQGTLYGRNATGGVVNIITQKAVLGDYSGYANFQYGNYDHIRAKGALNAPISDNAALRVAGMFLDRSGYTETVDPDAEFSSIDGRHLYSVRGSFAWEPSSATRIDVVASYFEEDDDRSRTGKSLCDFDPSGILGCLPTGNGFDSPNFSATLGGLLSSNRALGPLGLYAFGTIQNDPEPRDLRQVNVDTRPVYKADEVFVMAEVEQDLGGSLTLNLIGAYQDTSVFSNEFSPLMTDPGLRVPAALKVVLPINYAAFFADGLIPLSAGDESGTGSIGGHVLRKVNGIISYDESSAASEQYSFEARLTSSYDGPFNFMVAANYLDVVEQEHFALRSSALDYVAIVAPALFGAPDGTARIANSFSSETDRYSLQSVGIFGEAYYRVSDAVRLTAGARYIRDEKEVRDRNLPLLGGAFVPIGPNADAAADNYYQNAYDADPSTPGVQAYREASALFEEVTGRFVADYAPNVPFTDDTLLYAGYSRGYKSGGFNAPIDPSLATLFDIPGTFEPEFVNAFEAGAKNSLLGGALLANFSAFYYDYKGLQISRKIARATVNENVDASIWGAEAEFVYAPTKQLLFNLTAAHLNTKIDDFALLDSRDPTAGQAGHILIKDTRNADNCLVMNMPAALFTNLTGLPTVEIPGLASRGAFASCAALQSAGLNVVSGIERDVTGNELPYSPEWKVSVGAQYRHDFSGDLALILRSDYTWQADAWSQIYNDERRDKIEAWDVWNLQATLYGKDERWHLRAFVQNVLDKDYITGQYVSGESAGLATRITMLEPRLYGVEIGVKF